jgi:hypothetical protein
LDHFNSRKPIKACIINVRDMSVRKSAKKSDNRIVYIAVGAVAVIAAILFLSSGNSPTDGAEATTSTIPPSTAPETLSGNLRIESIEGDKLKIFNNENTVIKSSDISFFINNAAIRCSGTKDLEPQKVMECTLEARCQKSDILKITYSGKSIEYSC